MIFGYFVNIRRGHLATYLILLGSRGVKTHVLEVSKTRFCRLWAFRNCYLGGALRFCKMVFSTLFDSGNSSPLFWGELKTRYFSYFCKCSIKRHCYLLRVHWDMSKSDKKWRKVSKSVKMCVRGVEVWCRESFVLRGVKHGLWHLIDKTPKYTEIHRISDLLHNLTDVLTCVFRCFRDISGVLPLLREPAGFTLFFDEINGIYTKHAKTPVMTPLWHRLRPPGDRKGSLLDSLMETGRKPPRTEMRERSVSTPSTIEHAKKS